MMEADMEELSLTPGFGAKKVQFLFESFRKPLSRKLSSSSTSSS